MTRTQYKNNHIKNHYDRINLCIPKGQKDKIKAVAEANGISINEYLFMLICSDLSNGESRILESKQEFSENDTKLLDKWQISQKYRDMIDKIHVEEINGMNKHYTVTLKEGYINDITGSRNICTDKMKEIRRIIVKSHKKE
jgi:hypothetical protein